MAIAAGLINAILKTGVPQYPDQRVYNAAVRLLPEERPSLPVRTIEPDPNKYPIFRVRPNTEGMTNGGKYNTIYINKEAPAFKDDDLLSALLAHEAVHAKNLNTPAQYDELSAYRKQYEVLNRLKHKDPNYTRALIARIRSLENPRR